MKANEELKRAFVTLIEIPDNKNSLKGIKEGYERPAIAFYERQVRSGLCMMSDDFTEKVNETDGEW